MPDEAIGEFWPVARQMAGPALSRGARAAAVEDEILEVAKWKGTRRPGLRQGILTSVAHQTVYAGKVEHRGVMYEGEHASIIEPPDY
jgi:hypothetical protein